MPCAISITILPAFLPPMLMSRKHFGFFDFFPFLAFFFSVLGEVDGDAADEDDSAAAPGLLADGEADLPAN
jgi:hypothetical protein